MTVLRRFWPLVVAVGLLAVAGFGAAMGSLPLRPAPLGAKPEPATTWDPHLETQAARSQGTPGAAAQRMELSAGLVNLVQLVCLLVVVGVAVLLVVLLVRGAVQRRASSESSLVVRPPAPDTARDVLAAVDQGLVELDDDGDPRRAVIACWVRLEKAAEAAGVPRRPGDTSTDLVVRLLADRAVNGAVLNDFAALYREARYSPHRVDTSMRDDARAALRLLRDELSAPAAAGSGEWA